MVQLKSTPRSFTTPVEPSKRESIILKQKSISDLQTKKTQDRPASPAMATPIAASTVSVSTAAEPVIVASPDVIKEVSSITPEALWGST